MKSNNHTCGSLRLSYSSQKALQELGSTHDQLLEIERRVEEMNALLAHSADVSDLNQFKSELSQLEAKSKQLEAKGIDDVYTGELQSGRHLAKHAKRDMLMRLELLFGKVEAVFSLIK